jgi:hypothetical protein
MKNFLSFNKNLYSMLLYIYLILTGLSWICLHLYFRLFLKTPSYELSEIKLFLNHKILIIFIGFILLHFLIIISITILLYQKKYSKKPSSMFVNISQKLSSILNIIYWKPLEYIYEKIAPNMPGSGRFFLYLQKHGVLNYMIINIFIV